MKDENQYELDFADTQSNILVTLGAAWLLLAFGLTLILMACSSTGNVDGTVKGTWDIITKKDTDQKPAEAAKQ